MPEITANTTDGFQATGLTGTWDGTHDKTTSLQSLDINNTADGFFGWRAAYSAPRSAYYIVRNFFDWDVSGISGTVSAASVKIKTYSNQGAAAIVLQSGHDPSDTSTNWFTTWLTGLGGTISGWTSSSTGVTAFSAAVIPAASGNFTTFTLNSAGLSHLNSVAGTSNLFKIVVLDADFDYADTAPTGADVHGIYWADHGTSGNRPYLDYTIASFTGDINGYSNISVAGVNGIGRLNIAKVNGADS